MDDPLSVPSPFPGVEKLDIDDGSVPTDVGLTDSSEVGLAEGLEVG
jgi:hypothetical protein